MSDVIARAKRLLNMTTWYGPELTEADHVLRALVEECERLKARVGQIQEQCPHRFDSDGECFYCGAARE